MSCNTYSPLQSRQVATGGRVEEAEDGLAATLVPEQPWVDLLLAHLHDVVEAVEVERLDQLLGELDPPDVVNGRVGVMTLK